VSDLKNAVKNGAFKNKELISEKIKVL